MEYELHQGDCLQTLATLDAGIVQTCVTSPPYYGLRDYGVDGQIGLEESPEAYVEKLVQVFREVRRVLKDDGTLWLNLGDSYFSNTKGTGGSNPETSPKHAIKGRDNFQKFDAIRISAGETGCKPKDLIGVPWMVAFALRSDGWYLRSEIIWEKPNVFPESATDRPTRSHEHIFLLTKRQRYYYDAESVAEPALLTGGGTIATPDKAARSGITRNGTGATTLRSKDKTTRNKRTVWTVNTQPYEGAHFATFPPTLIEPCILAGSREGDTVLDPFNGSGTTGAVAIKHHRRYLGIELNPDYLALTRKRFEGIQPVLFPAQIAEQSLD